MKLFQSKRKVASDHSREKKILRSKTQTECNSIAISRSCLVLNQTFYVHHLFSYILMEEVFDGLNFSPCGHEPS